jgi:branched-chain amino acid transport system ATP-binding protein
LQVKLFQQVSSDPVAAGGASSDGSAVLRVEGLSAGYGKHQVLDAVSLEVAQGEFVALLGHNGAGKTTALRSIIGQVKPTAGTVSFDGEVLTGRPVHVTAAAGIGLVPQGQGVFPSLTIDENLALAASLRTAADTSAAETREFVYELFGMLKERPRERAGSLSGGQRQMLAIAMALMTSPRILLLDEPSTGLAPVLVEEVLRAVKRINHELGTSVLVVEQDIRRVLPFADRLYVIKLGSVAFAGTPDEFHEQNWSELF